VIFLILNQLVVHETNLNAFKYLTSRCILALITSILISMAVYPPFIKWLRALKLGQPIRELGPVSHFEKKGTPTMGGVVILFSTIFSAFLWMDITSKHFVTLLIVTFGYGIVGFFDDYLKISKKNSSGLASRYKMTGLIVFGVAAVWWHLWSFNPNVLAAHPNYTPTQIYFPFAKDFFIQLGALYFPFAVLVLVGSSNAVNLTDGLDGLVIGPIITCCIALTALSYITGNLVAAKYLYYHTVPGSGEITVFLCALIGASIGFLWYNTWPAQVFMGDSGALPLGGILGAVAMITGHEFLLVIMGGVFVVEAASVIIQVGSFKIRQKRVFRMAPLHHHFEKGGYPEQKITIRAWIISFMLALVSILTVKLR
jgi:phospho-N-acetylmuramoyl-pentapeptide-transferase